MDLFSPKARITNADLGKTNVLFCCSVIKVVVSDKWSEYKIRSEDSSGYRLESRRQRFWFQDQLFFEDIY